MSQLSFRIREVKCFDETGKGFFQELGADDIQLAAVAVDANRNVLKIPAFQVGGFDDGDKKVFSPPREMVSFDLPDGNSPATFLVNLVLIEKDSGNNIGPFLDQLVEATNGSMAKADSAGNPADPALNKSFWDEVLEVVLELAASLWKKARKDDIFPPTPIRVTVASLQVDKRPQVADFRAHNGHYEVVYDWAVT